MSDDKPPQEFPAFLYSGGATWAALQIAKELTAGVIVVILCDRGDRYLSSGLFGAKG